MCSQQLRLSDPAVERHHFDVYSSQGWGGYYENLEPRFDLICYWMESFHWTRQEDRKVGH